MIGIHSSLKSCLVIYNCKAEVLAVDINLSKSKFRFIVAYLSDFDDVDLISRTISNIQSL